MQISIINDCLDQNAKLRQTARIGSLFSNCAVNCFGVKSDLEAAGFLVDAIDAFEGREGIIIANVAPRNKEAEKWKNGTPFGFFWYQKTLIVSSLGGLTLSLVKKLGAIKSFYVFDITKVMASINNRELNKNTKQRIINSQFRSFDFLPRAAHWIFTEKKIPFNKYDLSKIPEAPNAIWLVDNFGNIKTTLLREEINLNSKNKFVAKIAGKTRSLNFYDHLSVFPDKTLGLTVGSSGIKEKKFLEIISRNGSASQKLKVKNNMEIKIV